MEEGVPVARPSLTQKSSSKSARVVAQVGVARGVLRISLGRYDGGNDDYDEEDNGHNTSRDRGLASNGATC